VATSYVTEAAAEQIRQAKRDILATQLAIRQPVALVLSRYDDPAGAWTVLPVQAVLLTYAGREPDESSSLGAQATYADGAFRKEQPFDVAVGDTFKLANGQAGRISGVPLPSAGLQTATFSVDVGS